MEIRKLLIYFHIKYKGDWAKIFEAIKTKEEVDLSMAEVTVNEYLSELKTHKKSIITTLDPEYPEWMKKVFMPPLVCEWFGDLEDLNNKQLIWVEEQKLAINLASRNLNTACIDSDGHIKIAISTGDDAFKLSVFYESKETSIKRLESICKKVLAVNGEEWFVDGVTKCPLKFALPGNSGCACNKLIKSGEWSLCDCREDLFWESESKEE